MTAFVNDYPDEAPAEPERPDDSQESYTHLPLYLDIRASNTENLKQTVLAGLPSKEMAIRLVEIFYGRVAWQYVFSISLAVSLNRLGASLLPVHGL